MRRVAILGANGFIGSSLVKTFENNGFEVVAFTRTIEKSRFQLVQKVNLFDSESIRTALSEYKPEIVISTAWNTEPGKFWTSIENGKYQEATLNFAELSIKSGAKTFIGLGTVSEYGASPGKCDAAHSSLVATDLYSKSKIETGLKLKELGEFYGVKTHWARIFQAFGPNEKIERLIPALISNLRKGNEFSISTPNYILDWIHVSDIADAIYFMLQNELDHFTDIGTGLATSVLEFSTLLCKELGFDMDLLDFSNQSPGHEKIAVVDQSSELLKKGWKPTQSLATRVRGLY